MDARGASCGLCPSINLLTLSVVGLLIVAGVLCEQVWTEWTDCLDVNCATGQGTRSRKQYSSWCKEGTCFKSYSEPCSVTNVLFHNCVATDLCPNCRSWSAFSVCSASCGQGNQFRQCLEQGSSDDPDVCQKPQIYVQNCTAPPCPGSSELENESSQTSVMGVMTVLVSSLLTFAVVIIVMLFLKKRQADRRRTQRANNHRGRFMQGCDGYNWIHNFRRRDHNGPINPRTGRDNAAFQADPQLTISPPSYSTAQEYMGGLSHGEPFSHHPTSPDSNGRESGSVFVLESSSRGVLDPVTAAAFISAAATTLPPGYEEIYSPQDARTNTVPHAASPIFNGKPPPAYDDIFNYDIDRSRTADVEKEEEDINPPPYQ